MVTVKGSSLLSEIVDESCFVDEYEKDDGRVDSDDDDNLVHAEAVEGHDEAHLGVFYI